MLRPRHGLGLALAGLLGLACSASPNNNTGGSGGNGASGGSGGNSGGTGGVANGGNGGTGNVTFGGFGGTGTGGSGTSCDTGPDEDGDGDGFSKTQGDCNDCDPNVSPNGLEVIITDPDPNTGMVPEPADEDCDGTIDNPPADTCDTGLAIGDQDPKSAAKAIDLCKFANGANDWGVISAAYTRAETAGNQAPPNPQQYGLLDNFGPNVAVQKGSRMLSLSSGAARDLGDPGACGSCSCNSGNQPGTNPPGIPQMIPACPPSPTIQDDVALNLVVRAPSNATGYKFLFKFYSFEFPEYVCSSFNDQFVALVAPPPMGAAPNGNISFDAAGNPVSVNVGFFDVCDPNLLQYYSVYGNGAVPPGGTCASGPAQLSGTGFGKGEFGDGCTGDFNDFGADAGGTGWLQTQAPIGGGEQFEIRFAIWDAGDTAYDSTVLVDSFQWIANGGTVVVGTEPPPPPN